MKNLIIGLASPAKGGKDMVADIIEEWSCGSGTPIIKMRFADPLKDLTASLFGWDRAKLDNDTPFKETPDTRWGLITPRKALQIIGTDMFREGLLHTGFGINMWVECMRDRLESVCESSGQMILIPDCRFLDEFRLIKSLNGTMVFMDPRPRIEKDIKAHASECEMWDYKDYDFTIDTGGSKGKTELEACSLASLFYNQLDGLN